MPVLEPPSAPGTQHDPEEVPFEQIREEVRRRGDAEDVQILRHETSSRLSEIKAQWPSLWSY